MAGLRTGMLVLVLLGAPAALVRAQGFVPGGWAPQFGYQPLGNMGLLGPGISGYGGAGAFGIGGYNPYANGMGMGFSPYGMGFSPYGTGVSPYGMGAMPPVYQGAFPNMAGPAPQTIMGTGPLINAISQSTRRSRGR